MSYNEKNRREEMDRFWDISRLVPPKPKNTHTPIKAAGHTEPISVTVLSEDETPPEDNQNRLTQTTPIGDRQKNQSSSSHSLIYAQYNDFSPLISHVKILNWKNTYNYYEFFCRQAAALYDKKGTECQEVHFFSYVAQYSQLNRDQMAWYLWWRQCVRNGIYLKTDVSYIYLLIFEIINLGNRIDTKVALEILVSLWVNYKDTYPQLVRALGDWICDYSLVHKEPLSFPDNRVDHELVSSVSLGEVFFTHEYFDSKRFSRLLLSFCNSYNYRKSKFYTAETQSLYDEHLPGVLEHLVSQIDIPKVLSQLPQKHTSRVAFTGALCSYKTRKHIEIDYISLCESGEIKSAVGNALKYAENRLRAYIGIRSRLGTTLDEKTKAKIDDYFLEKLSVSQGNSAQIPEYEKLYEAKDADFSLEHALNIERQSWEVTEKLVEAFEEENSEPICQEPEPLQIESINEESDVATFWSKIRSYSGFFQCVLQNDATGQREFIRINRLMPEAVVDEINDCAVEIFGDILIEETDDGYGVIEDYKSIFE